MPHVRRSLLAVAGLSALAAAVPPALAEDAPTTFFAEPESGMLIAIPGADGAAAIVATTAGIGSATVEATQSLVGNTVLQEGGLSRVEFTDSGNGLVGVFGINQEAGNMNQQANIRSIVVVDASGGPAALSLDINTSQQLTGNNLVLRDSGPREVSIANSFNGGAGIVGINQSAGNLNQQLGVVVVGIGLNAGPEAIQLGDAQLGQIGAGTDNSLTEEGVQGPRQNTLSNSFNDFSGIAQISQSTGDMNRVTQAVGVSVTLPVAP